MYLLIRTPLRNHAKQLIDEMLVYHADKIQSKISQAASAVWGNPLDKNNLDIDIDIEKP